MVDAQSATVLDWNDEILEGSIAKRFELVADELADKTAIKHKNEEITYAGLNDYANRIARYISAKSPTDGSPKPIAILIPQSIDLIAAEIALLKIGRPFIPLNTALPIDKINEIIAAANVDTVLLCHLLGDEAHAAGILANTYDISESTDDSTENVFRQHRADDIAYIIYTSGSTGVPKGVPQLHRHVLHNTMIHTQAFDITEQDRQTLLYPPHVYGSVRDTFNALLNGASLHILSVQTEELLSLYEWLKAEKITIYCSVATIFRRLIDWMGARSPLESVRIVKLGGEIVYKLDVENFQKYFPVSCKLSCGLASTETGAVSQYFIYNDSPVDGNVATLGMPVHGKRLTIVGEDGADLGFGEVGELVITSHYIAREYWNAPDLSRERFSVDPRSGETIYRTGDLAERLRDGTLIHRGRKDLMVKIRGNRIEIPEVEQAILATGDVRDVVAAEKKDLSGESVLVAYIEPKDQNGEFKAQSLREKLSRKLPTYMMPSYFIVLKQFPLLPNGKKNRLALPEIGRASQGPGASGSRIDVAPLQLVLEAAQKQLGGSEISIDTNFFDAGATSLKLLEIFKSLATAVDLPFTLVDFYRFPTIRLFASYLEHLSNPRAKDSVSAVRAAPPITVRRELDRDDGAIAIVGMACRYPGCETTAQFWSHLLAGTPLLEKVPVETLIARGVPEELVRSAGYIGVSSEIAHIEEVDAAYFSFSAKEAEMLDPQFRVLLECSVEAIEDAGEAVIGQGANVGVFVSVGKGNYFQNHILQNQQYLEQVGERRALLFNDRTYAASLVAYKLDLTGPTAHVEAACSSSLVAIHHAVRSLRAGDCAMALTGGVRILVPHGVGYEYGEAGFESADGVVRPFDKDANGTIFGSGAGILMLKPLKAAVHDKNHIYGVIQGTAMTNDGAGRAGFTTPGVRGQAAAVRRAHADAGIQPQQISFIEAHGTGTLVGDPIEIQALNEAFEGAPQHYRCPVGSVKSTLGHLSTAAGVTGVIKAILSLQEGVLPATANYSVANPLIAFNRGPFWVSSEKILLDTARRYAGVSSFGLGGTNVHAVLAAAPQAVDDGISPRTADIFPLSASSKDALAQKAKDLHAAILKKPTLRPQDISYTLAVGRNHGKFRSVHTAHDNNMLLETLSSASPDDVATVRDDLNIVFMFPGLGAQHVGMMKGLYDSHRYFRDLINHCATLLEPTLRLDFRSIIYPQPADQQNAELILSKPRNGQPILFAFEYCLAKLLEFHGVKASAYLGHSLGEYVAATLSGVFTLEDVLPLIALRGKLMEEAPEGAMSAIDAPEDVVRAMATQFGVSIAAVNAPNQIIVSGLSERIEDITTRFSEQGIRTKIIQTRHAFHSEQMEPVLDEFSAHLQKIPIGSPVTPIISNLSGGILANEDCNADYWRAHLRGTVLFANSIRAVSGDNTVFIEVGPSQTLTNFVLNILSENASIVSCCRHPKNQIDDDRQFKDALAACWARGADLDWSALFLDRTVRKVPLPTYPFQRQRYWIEAREHAVGVALEDKVDAIRRPEYVVEQGESSIKFAVMDIWAQLLGSGNMADDADFFSLGGDSMVLVQVQRRVGRHFGIKPTLGALYKNSTLENLSRYIAEMVQKNATL